MISSSARSADSATPTTSSSSYSPNSERRPSRTTVWPLLLGQTPHPPTRLDRASTLVLLGVSLSLQACFRARRIPITAQASVPDPVGALR